MSVIVIDPGHGGTEHIYKDPEHTKIDSSYNNAESPSHVLEKNVTLDLAKRIRASLVNGKGAQHAQQKGRALEVVMTREADKNLGLATRASVAADRSAKVYLSIHFNADDGKARGTECWIDRKYMTPVTVLSSGDTVYKEGPGLETSGIQNENVKEDEKFAKAVADAVFKALKAADPAAKLRSARYTAKEHGEAYSPPAGVKMKGLGALRDASLGTSSNHCCATLLEVDFLDHADFDALWNGAPGVKVRNAVADAVAKVLVDFS